MISYTERAQRCPSFAGKKLLQLMDEKQTNLALSADVTSSSDLLMLADLLGPHICMLKTHIDIIHDFTPALTVQLRELALRHQFIIFEDRKFADIGNTVKLQYEQGIYKIADWADVVNAHVLPGPGIIQSLAEAGRKKNLGLILLAEMSSAGHLMDKAYIQNTLKMAEKYPDFVIGFITQHAISDDLHWINMTPGVKLEQGKDALGQQYITPKQAIVENGSDVIIVGRGIIQADNPLTEAQKYKTAGWESYRERCGSQN
jgi:uridine monophosphate synthetase